MAIVRIVALTTMLAGAGHAETQAIDDQPLPWRRAVVPAFEITALNFGLLAFSSLVTQEPFADISAQSIEHNLRPSSWTFDVDYYLTNQFGHPYHGAQQFTAARSSGLSFWWSALYATLGSLSWELFFEKEAPSVNDQIMTPMGGALLGEALHRAALQLRDSGLPSWLSWLTATLVDPLGAINHVLLDEPPIADVTLDPLFVRWQLGATTGLVVDRVDSLARDRTPPQAWASVVLVSGAPWDRRSTYDAPLSYFDLRADLSFPSKVVGNIFIRGLLGGRRFATAHDHTQGVWGVFGAYDYAAPAIIRASAVAVGPGVVLQTGLGAAWQLQFGGHFGLSPFGAAGQLLEVSPDLGRDYHVGPGLQSVLDARILRPRWVQVELIARHWLVVGAYVPPWGFENITFLTLGVTVPLWEWLSLGAETTLSDRRARFADVRNEHDTGVSFRLTLNLSSNTHWGLGGR